MCEKYSLTKFASFFIIVLRAEIVTGIMVMSIFIVMSIFYTTPLVSEMQ